jgi:molybdopterin-guanine dinucleotide biosynthesis protein A
MSTESKDPDQTGPHVEGITGVILAGGKSGRFGKNKALVEIHGTRLIERVVGVLESIFKNVILISNTPHEYEYLQIPTYEDIIKGLGPIGGLQTGLTVIEDDAGFFVACDMPFLNKDLIHYMIESKGSYDGVVPRMDWKIEALHAIFTKSCLPAVNQSIISGKYQLITFLDKVHINYIDEDKIKIFDPELRSFININRPHQLDFAQEEKFIKRLDKDG